MNGDYLANGTSEKDIDVGAPIKKIKKIEMQPIKDSPQDTLLVWLARTVADYGAEKAMKALNDFKTTITGTPIPKETSDKMERMLEIGFYSMLIAMLTYIGIIIATLVS